MNIKTHELLYLLIDVTSHHKLHELNNYSLIEIPPNLFCHLTYLLLFELVVIYCLEVPHGYVVQGKYICFLFRK